MSEGAGSKRSSEGGNAWEGGKKMRGDTVTLRFLLRSKHAGGIIGKGGETIKRLRSEFSATVTVPDTNTGERVLSIGAEKDDCIKVLRECLPLVHEPPYPVNAGGRGEPKEPSPYEIDFLVHSSQVGGIIGRGGSRIKQLREETNASVKVYQECLPDSTERVVAIGGDEDQLVAALEQMLIVMQEQPIKGNITLYDPSYDHSQSGFDNYDGYNNFNGPPGRGGMGGGMRGGNRMGGGGDGGGPRGGGGMRGGMGGAMGGPGGRGPPGSNYGQGPQGGFGGGAGMGQQQDFGNNFGGDNYSNNFGNQGPPQGDSGFGGGAGGNFNNGAGGNFGGAAGGNQGNSPQTTTQVTIPNDMAGAIIGKGGERIRGIRQKCGADIKFSDSDPGKKDRLITISGSQDQIQYAQYLMQQCVRQNHHT